MPTKLEELIEKARGHKMSPEEQQAQIRSFAYGNTHMENNSITFDHIDRAMESLRSEREQATRS